MSHTPDTLMWMDDNTGWRLGKGKNVAEGYKG